MGDSGIVQDSQPTGCGPRVDYDCLTCGACCASQSPGRGYVFLRDEDIGRLAGVELPIVSSVVQDSDPPETVQALGTKLDPNGSKVCALLDGCSGGRNACSVYDRRPGACRGFEVGSLFCRLSRERFGLPV